MKDFFENKESLSREQLKQIKGGAMFDMCDYRPCDGVAYLCSAGVMCIGMMSITCQPTGPGCTIVPGVDPNEDPGPEDPGNG